MSWLSILPRDFVYIEVWITRFFFIMGALVLGPWLLLIVYDFFIYIFRITTYEIPYIGGRARNRPKPRAPTLSERPSGRPREFSMSVSGITTSADLGAQGVADGAESMQNLGPEPGHRRTSENPAMDK